MADKVINSFKEGLESAKEEFYTEAIQSFSFIVDNYPDHDLADDALYNIGLCYFEMNYINEALKHFERVTNEYPEADITDHESENEVGYTAAKAYYAIINCYIILGNIDKIKDVISLIKRKYPDSGIHVDEEKKTFYHLAKELAQKIGVELE